MKKALVLIIIPLIISGCTDYKELENIATITSIGVDYINNEYLVTYEILNNKKENDKVLYEAYTVSGTGESVSEAFIKTAAKIQLHPYFAHVELLLIDESIAKEHLKELTDFILRENELRERFFINVTHSSKELLNSTNKANPVISFTVKKLLEINQYSRYVFNKIPFDDFVSNIENLQVDNAVPFIEINNDTIEINKLAYFQNYHMQGFISRDMSYLYNLLNNKNTKYYLKHYFNNKIMEIGIMIDKSSITIKDGIIINLKASGSIINNETDLDLKNENTYQEINLAFAEELKIRIENFIRFLQSQNVDLLGLKNMYYIKNKKKLVDQWAKYAISTNVIVQIDKKGIIYNAIKKQ